MNPLPAPAAPPLYILPPASLLALAVLAGLILFALLLALAWKLWRRQRSKPPSTPPLPTPAGRQRVKTGSLGSAIESLEQRTLRTKAFRDGCHALAVLIKKHLEQVTGLGVEEMTSVEIEKTFVGGVASHDGARIGGAMLGAFMTGLSARRYGREEPRRRHFVAACEEARRLLTDDSAGGP